MHTISDVFRDIQKGILRNNMMENMFTYRIIFFVNEQGKGTKHYTDTTYGNLHNVLGNIVRNNLSLTNTIVISAVTVRKNKESVSLLSRSYPFSLNDYFQKLNGEYQNRDNYGSIIYRKKVSNWC